MPARRDALVAAVAAHNRSHKPPLPHSTVRLLEAMFASDDVCQQSLQTLEDVAGISRKHIQRVLRGLLAAGVIVKEDTGRQARRPLPPPAAGGERRMMTPLFHLLPPLPFPAPRFADRLPCGANWRSERLAPHVQPAIVRAHARASALSVTPGKSRRSSTAADSSPRCSKAARIAAASASVTTNMRGASAWRG
jgi:hypothetical protein